MRLFTYILTHDSGFAPNPFFGFCTLACCKPRIRRHAQKSDWVAGFNGINGGYKLIYAKEVTEEPVLIRDYFNCKRFHKKKPDLNSLDIRKRVGDNIYRPINVVDFEQLPSQHTPDQMKRDLSGVNVLISKNFWYFGSNPIKLNAELNAILPIGTRDYRRIDDQSLIRKFSHFLGKNEPGIYDKPTSWPSKATLNDDSLRCA